MNDAVVSAVENAPRFLGGHPDVAAIWVSIVIAFVQLVAIGYGLVQMHLASNVRNKQLTQQAIDSERRHEQAMAAFRSHGEELAQQNRKLDAQLEGFRLVMQRFAPEPPSATAG